MKTLVLFSNLKARQNSCKWQTIKLNFCLGIVLVPGDGSSYPSQGTLTEGQGAQCSRPPCTNQFRFNAFHNANITSFYNKTSSINEGVNFTVPSPLVSVACPSIHLDGEQSIFRGFSVSGLIQTFTLGREERLKAN